MKIVFVEESNDTPCKKICQIIEAVYLPETIHFILSRIHVFSRIWQKLPFHKNHKYSISVWVRKGQINCVSIRGEKRSSKPVPSRWREIKMDVWTEKIKIFCYAIRLLSSDNNLAFFNMFIFVQNFIIYLFIQ